MRSIAPILLLYILIITTPVTADETQNNWAVDTDFRTGTELSATQVYPQGVVPIGSVFRISINAWSDVGALNELSFSMLQVSAGCEIISQTTDISQALVDKSITADASLRMVGDSCTWKRVVYANDTVIGNVAEIRAVGSIHASTTSIGIFGVTGVEFLAFFVVLSGSVYFWSKSADEVIQLLSSLVTVLIGFAFISIPGVGWAFANTFGVITTAVGGYMLVRMAIDRFRET